MPGHDAIVPFFAVQRGAVELIAPKADDSRIETAGSAGHTAPWSISCLFHRGAVHGNLDFLMNLRLSDYLRQQTGFLLLREASWVPLDGTQEDRPRRWTTAFVNVPQVNGISEAVDQRGRGHPGQAGRAVGVRAAGGAADLRIAAQCSIELNSGRECTRMHANARESQSTARLPCIRVHSRAFAAALGRSAAHPPPGIIIALSGLDSAQRATSVLQYATCGGGRAVA